MNELTRLFIIGDNLQRDAEAGMNVTGIETVNELKNIYIEELLEKGELF